MKYYVVCDAGGTKSDCMVFTQTGEVVGESHGLAGNARFLTEEVASAQIAACILEGLHNADATPEQVAGVYVFIPGFAHCSALLQQKIGISAVFCEDDRKSALYAAIGKGIGIVMLCGTGSFAYGYDSEGHAAISGAWGPLLGDFGSGYHIGLLCLQKLARLADHQITQTPMMMLAHEALGVTRTHELRRKAYQAEFTRATIAGLCPIVGQAAKQSDYDAIEILQTAAKMATEDVCNVVRQLKQEQLTVSLVGGVSKVGSHFIDCFVQTLQSKAPSLQYQPPQYAPIEGAALCVMHEILGVPVEEAKKQLAMRYE